MNDLSIQDKHKEPEYGLFGSPVYSKLYGDTVVSFLHFGFEVRLNKAECLQAIANIEAERDSYATQEVYDRARSAYVGAAVFMGWFSDSEPVGE